jgi:hypothetical protein
MDQYKDSAPIRPQEPKTESDKAQVETMRDLRTIISDQQQQIQRLEKDMQRIKNKMDLHAAAINRMVNGKANNTK